MYGLDKNFHGHVYVMSWYLGGSLVLVTPVPDNYFILFFYLVN